MNSGFPRIRRTLAIAALAALFAPGMWITTAFAATNITGAGSTFAYPIYGKWAAIYKRKTGVGLNYQSIGSGAGIRQIKAGTVSFGASDRPLGIKELDKAGLWQWPQVIGGVVPVINLPGFGPGQITLDGPTLAAMFRGKIQFWDDPAIAKLNPGVKLPHIWVAPVYRADGSGTTYLFTTYLTDVSPKWKREIGASTMVEWPVGIGAKGNEAVASMVLNTRGAVGYVEYAYVVQAKMTNVKLINRAGHAVAPTVAAFQSAASHADWASVPGFGLMLDNEPGAKTWPITGATFVLVHRQSEKSLTPLLSFFDWGFRHGRKAATELGYVPLPMDIVKLVEASWAARLHGPEGKPAWPRTSGHSSGHAR